MVGKERGKVVASSNGRRHRGPPSSSAAKRRGTRQSSSATPSVGEHLGRKRDLDPPSYWVPRSFSELRFRPRRGSATGHLRQGCRISPQTGGENVSRETFSP